MPTSMELFNDMRQSDQQKPSFIDRKNAFFIRRLKMDQITTVDRIPTTV